MKRKIILIVLLVSCFSFSLSATKRSIPVDVILMIDKSLSMQEKGKFDSLKKWVVDELIDQMLIIGDHIEIYQFYEKPEHLMSIKLNNENDKQRVVNTINAIEPNGEFTDIGRALDTISYAAQKLAKSSGEKYSILLMVTDLEQDAPLASKYAGKQKKFKSPYLVESRIIKHDKWYEITLDMRIQDRVVETTQELFTDIEKNKNTDRTEADENEALIKENN